MQKAEGQSNCIAEQRDSMVQGKAREESRGQAQKRLELFLTLRALSNDWGLGNAFLA